MRSICFSVAVVFLVAACSRNEPPQNNPAAERPSVKPRPANKAPVAAKPKAKAICDVPELATRFSAAKRVVAMGDVHGDGKATRRALRLAGAIDASDKWIGGKLVLVQVGDILDRGDDEQEIMELFESLRVQARAAGGAVHVLNGNHETLNARGVFNYVTPGGFADFEDAPGVADALGETKGNERALKARKLAFAPGGPFAKILAQHNTVVIVGDTLFVHGGVLPDYVTYGLRKLNTELRCWLAGKTPPPKALRDPSNPLWSRAYSAGKAQCGILKRTLEMLKLKRMVVAHTPQAGINAACDGMVWRIDTGMAAHYSGPTQVLELTKSGPRVLSYGKK